MKSLGMGWVHGRMCARVERLMLTIPSGRIQTSKLRVENVHWSLGVEDLEVGRCLCPLCPVNV
jgi:hypothetical protein